MFCFKLHITPMELRRLEFYTIEYILKEYEEHVKKENEEYEKQQREAEKKYKTSSAPSTDYGGFKVPRVEMPKFDMPKFNLPR